jgi:hypothetical protein
MEERKDWKSIGMGFFYNWENEEQEEGQDYF